MRNHEIRQNKATRQWVIYSRARKKRPRDYETVRRKAGPVTLPRRDPHCPFCPGNEEQLPPVIWERKDPGGGWLLRVVPNKFPALTPEGSGRRIERGVYLAMEGCGSHEVIIESPRHDCQLPGMDPERMDSLVEAYHRRYTALMEQPGIMSVILFRNHGALAGTSLIHPHSQVLATGMAPHHIRRREEEAQRYFDELGRCVYCDMLEFERQDRRRVVFENRSFLAFVPFAADSPFELWVVPTRHAADFGSLGDAETGDFGAALRHCLGLLSERLGDPAYNYVINTATRFREREPYLHWHLQIRPRLITPAGFEMGSGISINPSLPEEDADFLNGAPEAD